MRHWFHRHIWPLFPYHLRRAVLFGASARLAKRFPAADARLPIIIAGTFGSASGLAQSAVLSYRALTQMAVPTFAIDLTAQLFQPIDSFPMEFVDGVAHRGPGTVILHINSPLVPLAVLALGRSVLRQKRIVGCWAWELPQVPHDWKHGISFVHEIWVPSTFTANAIRPIAGDVPVRVVPYPVAGKQALAPRTRSATFGRPFTVLVIFDMASGFSRKNPLAAIAAFRKAFNEDGSVRLVIKISRSETFPPGKRAIDDAVRCSRNIVVIDRLMTHAEIDDLYVESDVLLSLHRAEGFGLTLAEAMLRGIPVIATNWSGNADYLSTETGVPVPSVLVPATDPQRTYHYPGMVWAEPDIDAAAEALRLLRNDPVLADRLGRAGAAYAVRHWCSEKYVDIIRGYLQL